MSRATDFKQALKPLTTGLSAVLQDHEIFRLQDELEAAEGLEVTFYGTLSSQYIL